jgi:hypothetical protein
MKAAKYNQLCCCAIPTQHFERQISFPGADDVGAAEKFLLPAPFAARRCIFSKDNGK